MTDHRPTIALTLGDVCGVGPETVVRALATFPAESFLPVVVGHPDVLRRALALVGASRMVVEVDGPEDAGRGGEALACWNPSAADVGSLTPAKVDARAGQAAYDWLVAATRAALAERIDAIVTAPLNKYALHQAGLDFPGHTEILAHECGVAEYAMMLYLPPAEADAAGVRNPNALSVAHATLHTSIASVPGLLTENRIRETIELVDHFLQRIGQPTRRIGVCALNPHAGEEGLFGEEEMRVIGPAVAGSRRDGLDAVGPFPADTLLKRAVEGEFDGVVAMYHDQGHIALKLIGFHRAVNVTLGLPIIRTSPSQGTAFDIAWQGGGKADPSGMQAAIDVALRLVASRG